MTTIITVSMPKTSPHSVEIRGIYLDEDGHEIHKDFSPAIVNPGETVDFTVYDKRKLEISEIS